MTDKKLLKTGIIGTLVMILCCFTPALVILLGSLGLSAWLVGADFVLLPLLFGFLALTVFAVKRKSKTKIEVQNEP